MVIGLNYSAFKSLFQNADGMADGVEYIENTYSLKTLTEFIGKKPEFVSIVSYNINHPDSGIFYGADIPRTMGALGNILLLIEYERQIALGILNPDDLIEFNAHEGFQVSVFERLGVCMKCAQIVEMQLFVGNEIVYIRSVIIVQHICIIFCVQSM